MWELQVHVVAHVSKFKFRGKDGMGLGFDIGYSSDANDDFFDFVQIKFHDSLIPTSFDTNDSCSCSKTRFLKLYIGHYLQAHFRREQSQLHRLNKKGKTSGRTHAHICLYGQAYAWNQSLCTPSARKIGILCGMINKTWRFLPLSEGYFMVNSWLFVIS